MRTFEICRKRHRRYIFICTTLKRHSVEPRECTLIFQRHVIFILDMQWIYSGYDFSHKIIYPNLLLSKAILQMTTHWLATKIPSPSEVILGTPAQYQGHIYKHILTLIPASIDNLINCTCTIELLVHGWILKIDKQHYPRFHFGCNYFWCYDYSQPILARASAILREISK